MSAITVGVRVRPFNSREIKYNAKNIVAMDHATSTVKLSVVRQGRVVDEKPKEFVFDHLFWTHDGAPGAEADCPSEIPFAGQDTVYDSLGKSVVENVCEGYNACLFAYGQTGSGKTYSMLGYGGDTGVIPKACDDLFGRLRALGLVTVECSYLEIYNEVVKDLLCPADTVAGAAGLKIRQHPKTGVFVEGLRKVVVHSPEEVLRLLDEGGKVRAVAATSMNATSSRSHAVLMLTVSQLSDDLQGAATGKVGRMSMIDLAGSERASSTGATGDTLAEGASINKSLSVLGMCLGRLADKADGGKGSHIPFRDSSLTFLLSESLGGNSKTSMLAAISPADVNFEETLSTLRFAQVTKRVKNNAVVNENPTARLIRELRDELAQLKLQLGALEAAATAIPHTPVARDGDGAGGDEVLTEEQLADLPEANDEQGAADAAEELRRRIQESEAAERALEVAAEDFSSLSPAQDVPDVSTDSGVDPRSGSAAAGSVFVDWCRPQLVNICPDSSTLVLHVQEGMNFYIFADPADPTAAIKHATTSTSADDHPVAFSISFDPLRNACTFSVAPREGLDTRSPPFLNGQQIHLAGEAAFVTRLAHGDRIIIGKVALRFAHSSSLGSAPDFSAIPRDTEHAEQLERYHRYSRIELSFFTKLQRMHLALQQSLASVREKEGGHAKSDDDDDDEEEGRSLFVRGLDSIVALLTSLSQKAEERLAADYPITSDELLAFSQRKVARLKQSAASPSSPVEIAGGDGGGNDDCDDDDDDGYDWAVRGAGAAPVLTDGTIFGDTIAHEYDAAIAEQRAAIRKKDELISQLRTEIEHATVDRRRRELSMVRRKEEHEQLERSQEAELARQLEAELQWHAEVKRAKKFSESGPPPTRAADHGMYQRIIRGGADMPFLQELIELQAEVLGRPRVSSIISAPTNAPRNPSVPAGPAQCGTIFKMSQHKQKKWEQRYGVIVKRFLHYFHVCDGRQRAQGSIYLYGATITDVPETRDMGRPHVILLTSAAPRRPNDTHTFYLSFTSAADKELWCRWISVASVPPLPLSMSERMESECAAATAAGKPLPQQWRYIWRSGASASDVVLREDPAAIPGTAATTVEKGSRSNWKPDEMVLGCEACQAAFTFFNRRHHCRGCGKIFCSSCSPKREANFGGVMKVKRVCDACFASGTQFEAGGHTDEPTHVA